MFKFHSSCLLMLAILCNMVGYSRPTGADRSQLCKISSAIILNKADVNIFSERVNMKIMGDYAMLKVDYEVWNNKEGGDATVQLGIPFIMGATKDETLDWEADFIQDFKAVSEGGKELTVIPEFTGVSPNDTLELDKNRLAVRTKRKIYAFSIQIPQLSSKTVTISYKIKSYYRDIKTNNNFFPKYSPRLLQYDFSPAVDWGKGTIRDFSMIIDCGDIPKDFVHISGVGFNSMQWNDGFYMLNQTDMTVYKHSVMRLEYDYNVSAYNEFLVTYRCPSEKLLKTKVSSQSDVFEGPENLYDMNFNTVWAEGVSHQGSGEFLEILLDDYPLCGLGIINGFRKSKDDFSENGRVSKVEVEREYIDAGGCLKKDVQITDLGAEVYKKVNTNNFSKSVSIIADYGNTQLRVRKVRITILEANPGEKYDRTAISELIILGNE